CDCSSGRVGRYQVAEKWNAGKELDETSPAWHSGEPPWLAALYASLFGGVKKVSCGRLDRLRRGESIIPGYDSMASHRRTIAYDNRSESYCPCQRGETRRPVQSRPSGRWLPLCLRARHPRCKGRGA